MMYQYRHLTEAEQAATVAERIRRGFPWHGPPHPEKPGEYRLISAACYEHQHILHKAERMQWFEQELLDTLKELNCHCAAWCVLSNHYHILVQIDNMRVFSRALGKLHGRTSFQMNSEDDQREHPRQEPERASIHPQPCPEREAAGDFTEGGKPVP